MQFVDFSPTENTSITRAQTKNEDITSTTEDPLCALSQLLPQENLISWFLSRYIGSAFWVLFLFLYKSYSVLSLVPGFICSTSCLWDSSILLHVDHFFLLVALYSTVWVSPNYFIKESGRDRRCRAVYPFWQLFPYSPFEYISIYINIRY